MESFKITLFQNQGMERKSETGKRDRHESQIREIMVSPEYHGGAKSGAAHAAK